MAGFLRRDLAACKRFKAKLQARELATLIHSSHPAPSLVERLAECGFDAALIDPEHGSVRRERVEEMARAISSTRSRRTEPCSGSMSAASKPHSASRSTRLGAG